MEARVLEVEGLGLEADGGAEGDLGGGYFVGNLLFVEVGDFGEGEGEEGGEEEGREGHTCATHASIIMFM